MFLTTYRGGSHLPADITLAYRYNEKSHRSHTHMKSMALLIFYYFNIKSFYFVRYYAVSFAIFLQFRKPYVELMKLIVFIMIISSAEESPA